MNPLDAKINEHFAGLVVRKDLVRAVKGNAIVPTYVLEYLLGQYCATADEDSIEAGIDTVRDILREHYVHRSEANLVRSVIRERGQHRVIDKISVELNDRTDTYEATFTNLGVSQVLVDADTVRRHPKLLVTGVWCIADLSYQFSEDRRVSPWILQSLKPIQLSYFDLEAYIAARDKFTLDEWLDLLLQSIGFNPEVFGVRSKMLQLIRLIPYCERNYNLIELGPKGTGKSHIYSEFSPHGILLSGGEVTVPKLFVNNATGRIGLVGYWDAVAFDEFAGRNKRSNQALVDILKNYMANKSFSRGIETLGAEASLAFVGNTSHTVAYMLRHTDLFDDLPAQYHDSAFLDRVHCYIPGWEIDIIRGEMFSTGYGFVVDYLAEVLRALRDYDYSQRYERFYALADDMSTRDRDGVRKTFSGLVKLLFPGGEVSAQEAGMVLRYAIEGRKRVKDQLMRIDATYAQARFAYASLSDGVTHSVKTLEETSYPQHYYRGGAAAAVTPQDSESAAKTPAPGNSTAAAINPPLQEQHLTFAENQTGVSFLELFGPYLQGARRIVITDPYIRQFYQARNLMELIEVVAALKHDDDEIAIGLVTSRDDMDFARQEEYLSRIAESVARAGIQFTWQFDEHEAIHARHIATDHGWRILLDRGLDIYQRFDAGDAFSVAARLPKHRAVKAFEVTFLRVE
ncbi:MAG: BREX system Lon protease-like protein BrxL [Anaerolineales bacterium]|nr:BREX system Lon protease-like protein BrxL [Anaerolineales bacterium]